MATKATTGATGALTDGTGVSPLTRSKVLKDLVLDFLLGVAAALGTDATFEALDLGSILDAPEAAALAVGGALIRTLFRGALRWASTP